MITASLSWGGSLVIGDQRVSFSSLVDMVHLGRQVPVIKLGETVGTARISGNLVHVVTKGRHQIMARKYLMGILEGEIPAAYVQEVPV